MLRIAAAFLAGVLATPAIAAAGQAASGLSAAGRSALVSRPAGSVERAVQWVSAVLTHEPGAVDDALAVVDRWTEPMAANLLIELNSIRLLMRDPRTRAFPVPFELDRGRSQEIRYSGSERESLEQAATRAVTAGLSDDDLIARAIVLHTDVAVLGAGTGNILRFVDGQGMDLERRNADHWQLARSLGDRLNAKAGRDEDLALWYRATLTQMASVQLLNVTHAARAVARFKDDAQLQFLAGCLHETLASPSTQASLAASRLPAGTTSRVGDAGDELQKAAAFLRRAVDLDGPHLDARLHYGRVLTLTGRAVAAVAELRRVTADVADVDRSYYAQLFLGAALAAANQPSEARAAYAAAAARAPGAQAPLLALSELAAASGDRRAAATALEPIFAAAGDDERHDPWWDYFVAHGRDAAALIADARARLVTPRGRTPR